MAAVDLPAAQSDYAYAEQELQNHILEVYGTNNNSDDMFRPALADSQKIGFFSLDRNSQTEISEIVDLKEMTEVLQILLQDVATLRRDINFTKHVMQADHESKLQQKSLELYCRINERVIELEKIHEDRVSALRKAFKQQLADAIARLSTMYKKNLESNIHRERTRQEWDLKNQDSRMQELKSTVGSDTPVTSSRIQQLEGEVEDLQKETEKLDRKNKRLEDALEIKEEQTSQLQLQVEDLQRRLEKEKILSDQLKHEKEEIRVEAEKEVQQSKKQV
ncbi:hypothetical protein BaRGS_00025538 [Batillaria attramentaria]|uniref:DUF4709 domain-containing protein n=1 Tax=Batillaria attramentaria TaxID=370345 RepID=A0ABD0K852_9CAEN